MGERAAVSLTEEVRKANTCEKHKQNTKLVVDSWTQTHDCLLG